MHCANQREMSAVALSHIDRHMVVNSGAILQVGDLSPARRACDVIALDSDVTDRDSTEEEEGFDVMTSEATFNMDVMPSSASR